MLTRYARLSLSGPVLSMNARICAVALPKRVPLPRMIASASAVRLASATGTWANAFLASTAPIFASTSFGSVSATCSSSTCAPGTCRAPSATASAIFQTCPYML